MTSRQTIRHRLFVSNVIMVVVPVLVTAFVGVVCLAVMLNTASHKGLGLDSESAPTSTGQEPRRQSWSRTLWATPRQRLPRMSGIVSLLRARS